MHYDMRADRLGWTLFDVTTDRAVIWATYLSEAVWKRRFQVAVSYDSSS
jgi:hypothetical protein